MLHSLILPPTPSTSAPSRVKAIVAVERQVLLLRRPSGEWDLPGGRCDDGETLEETLQREMREEIGMMPRQAQFLQSAWRQRNNKPPVHVAFFGCQIDRQQLATELQLSAEHQDAQLIDLAALNGLTMPVLYAQMALLWLQTDLISK
jgi:8-oxo-dGTP diphosphatase